MFAKANAFSQMERSAFWLNLSDVLLNIRADVFLPVLKPSPINIQRKNSSILQTGQLSGQSFGQFIIEITGQEEVRWNKTLQSNKGVIVSEHCSGGILEFLLPESNLPGLYNKAWVPV